MRETAKLIIVEGIPGSGKSTTAGIVYDILKSKGVKAELFCEGNYNHPADYDGVAYFSFKDFDSLKQKHSRFKEILDKIKIEHDYGYLTPYRKAIEEQEILFDDELLNDIAQNDIYEIAIDKHMNLIVNRWDDFVTQYVNDDKVVIFECCFIQNPVTVTMIRNNSPQKVTMSYINSLAKIIIPLKPILIYVEQDDIEASFKKVSDKRPKEWFEGFKDYYTNQGYGLNNNLKGIDGVIRVLKARNTFEQEIYKSLSCDKYKINNTAFDLDSHKERIASILEAYWKA